jgi:hypothetical protein
MRPGVVIAVYPAVDRVLRGGQRLERRCIIEQLRPQRQAAEITEVNGK